MRVARSGWQRVVLDRYHILLSATLAPIMMVSFCV